VIVMSTEFTVTGNLAADPQLRYTPAGKPVAKFTVISNDRRFDPQTRRWVDGSQQTAVRVTAWESLAENAAESLRKGSRVTVTGHRVEAHAWIGEKDEEPHAALELTADEVAIGLRWHTVTAEKATRTLGSGEGEVEVDAREADRLLRGAQERRADPASVDDPAELQARVDLMRGHLGAEWAETEGSAAGPEGGGS
jgi:single-strand DNA-binding protein